jgi:hypothetical protein
MTLTGTTEELWEEWAWEDLEEWALARAWA